MKRPSVAPARIPGWAWELMRWHDRNRKGNRPSAAPARVPAWYWPWRVWMLWRRKHPQDAATTLGRDALARAIGQLGVKEYPARSNRVLFSEWYGVIDEWCAMFGSWCYSKAGRPLRYAYVPTLLNDARAGRRGLSVTVDPAPGDLVIYDWESDRTVDHVGLFQAWIVRGYSFLAVEGNTAVGHDSNGGEVMRRSRYMRSVAAFVRVNDKPTL